MNKSKDLPEVIRNFVGKAHGSSTAHIQQATLEKVPPPER